MTCTYYTHNYRYMGNTLQEAEMAEEKYGGEELLEYLKIELDDGTEEWISYKE